MAGKARAEGESLEGMDAKRWGLPLEAVESLGRQLYDCWEGFHDCDTRDSIRQFPDRPCFQVQFPLRIRGVHLTADLYLSDDKPR